MTVAAPSFHYFKRPADAFPVGRDRHIVVSPDGRGAWRVEECDDGGASILGHGLTKAEALAIGLPWVTDLNATLTVDNGEDAPRIECAYPALEDRS